MLQHLVDYYSHPGLMRNSVRNDGVLQISSNIQKRLQAYINDLATLDSSIVIEERHLENENVAVLVPVMQISSPVSPAQSHFEETTLLHIQTDRSLSPVYTTSSPQATPSDSTIEAEWNAKHATNARKHLSLKSAWKPSSRNSTILGRNLRLLGHHIHRSHLVHRGRYRRLQCRTITTLKNI